MGSWIEFSGSATPLPGGEASRARRASILPLSFLGMALLLAPIYVAEISDVAGKTLELRPMLVAKSTRASTEAAFVCRMSLHSKSFAGIFPGKDPPMVKSATDFDRGRM